MTCVFLYDGGDHWTENPEPQFMERWLLHDESVRELHMMLEPDILFIMDFCGTYMTVYNPKEEDLQMLRTLAASEGLFVWQLPRDIRCH